MYLEFLEISPNNLVTEYYNNNWHNIKSEWVEGLKSRKINFNESTNNRLESFFQKLKSCVTARISIKDLITKFLGLVSLRTERTLKNITSKVPVFNTLCTDEKQLPTLLTPYTFKHVKQQLQKSTDIHVSEDGQVQNGLVTVTEDDCTCGTFQSMGLPCSHLLAWR